MTSAILVTTACGSNPGESIDDLPENMIHSFNVELVIQEALEARETNTPGPSDEQIATLEMIKEDQTVSFETYSDAVDRSIECMENAGYGVLDFGTKVELGTKVRSYGLQPPQGLSEAAELDISVSCPMTHSMFIERLYASQPSSQESYLNEVNAQRDSIVKCLKGLGHETEEGISARDLLFAVTEASLLYGTTCYSGQVFVGYLDPARHDEIIAEYIRRNPVD